MLLYVLCGVMAIVGLILLNVKVFTIGKGKYKYEFRNPTRDMWGDSILGGMLVGVGGIFGVVLLVLQLSFNMDYKTTKVFWEQNRNVINASINNPNITSNEREKAISLITELNNNIGVYEIYHKSKWIGIFQNPYWGTVEPMSVDVIPHSKEHYMIEQK